MAATRSKSFPQVSHFTIWKYQNYYIEIQKYKNHTKITKKIQTWRLPLRSRSLPLLLYFTLFCRSSNKLSRTKAKTIFPITTNTGRKLSPAPQMFFPRKTGTILYLVEAVASWLGSAKKVGVVANLGSRTLGAVGGEGNPLIIFF